MAKRPSQTKKRVRVKGNRVVVDPDMPNLSETLLSFAKPLIESLSNHSPSLDEIRQAMHYASIVWNVHVLAQDDPGVASEALAVLDDLPDTLGPNAPDILRDMLEARKTKYAHDRRFVSVDVMEAEGGWTISTQGATMDPMPKSP
jgi:hypothetical protein